MWGGRVTTPDPREISVWLFGPHPILGVLPSVRALPPCHIHEHAFIFGQLADPTPVVKEGC